MEQHLNLNSSEKEIINKSGSVDPGLLSSYIQNRAVDEPAYTLLIIMYSILILAGSLGNLLVIASVVRKPAMRTPRNLFIVNLAVSDFILCTVTMPLTLMELLTKYWPLGNYYWLCKMERSLQAISIFVTTITIIVIALDRYRVIVYPTRENWDLMLTPFILLSIWTIALILASPLFIYTRLVHYDIQFNGTDLNGINYCIEDWPISNGRLLYSIFSIIFQYLVPITIVSVAYLGIYLKLRYRFAAGFVSNEEFTQSASRRQLRGRRLKRTNILLVSIAIIFCVSWLPLNLFNLIADIYRSDEFTKNMIIIYAICHMIGMSSACSNPVLYGWLNENFWKEFKDIMCISTSSSDNGTTIKQRTSIRKPSKKLLKRETPDLVVVDAEYRPETNMNTEMTNFTS